MKIVVTGTRGIPDIPGGVETHCQQLYPLVVALGHEVVLLTRSPYVVNRRPEWRGVRLVHTWCPRGRSLEAIGHTFVALLKARLMSPDIVHVHAVGPGLLVPLARLMGLKVVFTSHGPDYDRKKWGALARGVLRLGEYFGGKYANEVIAISRGIASIVSDRCGRPAHLIMNGVTLPERRGGGISEQTGRSPSGRYILAVARLVPEKGLHDLVSAFSGIAGDVKLIIAGDADHESEYSKGLRDQAKRDPRITMVGYVTGEPLRRLYAQADLFVLPSYHEGLPIVLLEAMSHGLAILASDIPANKEVALPERCYFPCGDVRALRDGIQAALGRGISPEERAQLRARVAREFDWRSIARQTVEVYHKALGRTAVSRTTGLAA